MILRRLVPALAAAALVLLTAAVVTRFGPLLSADAGINAAARATSLAHPAWRSAMYAVTTTANTTTVLPLAAVACGFLLWLRRWQHVYVLLGAVVATTAIRLLILAAVHRPRPEGWLAPAAGWSYPSGHTTASATAAGLLIVIGGSFLPGRRSRAALAVVAGLWAASVGVSRVALSVHWPTDVLAAWLMVTAILTTLTLIVKPR